MYYESDAILLLLKKHFSYIFFLNHNLKVQKRRGILVSNKNTLNKNYLKKVFRTTQIAKNVAFIKNKLK